MAPISGPWQVLHITTAVPGVIPLPLILASGVPICGRIVPDQDAIDPPPPDPILRCGRGAGLEIDFDLVPLPPAYNSGTRINVGVAHKAPLANMIIVIVERVRAPNQWSASIV